MIWTPPMDDALTAAWHASLPTPQIAALIGLGITASAVRGRARDLHLPMRGEFENTWGGKYKGGSPLVRRTRPLPDIAKLGPDSAPVTWAARDFDQCEFPVGESDGGLLVCGGPIPSGARRRYCRFHIALTVSAVNAA